MSHCDVCNMFARRFGGFAFAYTGIQISVADCQFRNMTANSGGLLIHTYSYGCQIVRCRISRVRASGMEYSGLMFRYAGSGTLTLSNSIFADVAVAEDAFPGETGEAALFAESAGVTNVYDCTFANFTGTGSRATLYHGQASSTLLMERCIVIGMHTDRETSLCSAIDCTLEIHDSSFVESSSTLGRAFELTASTLALWHCTVSAVRNASGHARNGAFIRATAWSSRAHSLAVLNFVNFTEFDTCTAFSDRCDLYRGETEGGAVNLATMDVVLREVIMPSQSCEDASSSTLSDPLHTLRCAGINYVDPWEIVVSLCATDATCIEQPIGSPSLNAVSLTCACVAPNVINPVVLDATEDPAIVPYYFEKALPVRWLVPQAATNLAHEPGCLTPLRMQTPGVSWARFCVSLDLFPSHAPSDSRLCWPFADLSTPMLPGVLCRNYGCSLQTRRRERLAERTDGGHRSDQHVLLASDQRTAFVAANGMGVVAFASQFNP
jgi:hypothetical protein